VAQAVQVVLAVHQVNQVLLVPQDLVVLVVNQEQAVDQA
jgi:hypothetical protein